MTKSVTGPRHGVLTYHEVGATPSGYIYSISAAQLDDHVRSLMPEAALFTFDDGHQSHLHQAAPVLEKYGARGVFFVTAGWTESRPGYMSWAELRELAARGHRIQAHGWSHKFLRTVPMRSYPRNWSAPRRLWRTAWVVRLIRFPRRAAGGTGEWHGPVKLPGTAACMYRFHGTRVETAAAFPCWAASWYDARWTSRLCSASSIWDGGTAGSRS